MSTNEQRTKRALFVVMCHLYWKEDGRNTVVTAGKSMHSFQMGSVPLVPFSISFTLNN